MTETNRPAFKLHKKPEPKPEPRFLVTKDKDDIYSIEMNGYTVLGGLTKRDVMSLTSSLLTSTQTFEGLSDVRAQAKMGSLVAARAPLTYGPFGRADAGRGLFGW